MNIGEVEAATGVSQRMIRHYEKIGLVPSPSRTSGGYRDYGDADVARIRFIGLARTIGLEIDSISDMLGLWNDVRSPEETAQLARVRVEALATRWRSIIELSAALEGLAEGAARGLPPSFPWGGTA
jgi:DNA-binding transcriptional MerR regulator